MHDLCFYQRSMVLLMKYCPLFGSTMEHPKKVNKMSDFLNTGQLGRQGTVQTISSNVKYLSLFFLFLNRNYTPEKKLLR